jgi:hypothetical protein
MGHDRSTFRVLLAAFAPEFPNQHESGFAHLLKWLFFLGGYHDYMRIRAIVSDNVFRYITLSY